MKAMVLERAGLPLRLRDVAAPRPGPGQLLLRVGACGVCRTDLHLCDGELAVSVLPRIPGHEIVGTVVETGPAVRGVTIGQRIGVGWLGRTCGNCAYCRAGTENLCDDALFTGHGIDGGYAEYAIADHRFCFSIPEDYDDTRAAPLLCAGLIGYRALRMAGDARRIGLYGFGAAAHIVAQLAANRGQRVFAFTRPGDEAGQAFARRMGAEWAGPSDRPSPEPLDVAILFAPVGSLVPLALRAVTKGGVVICAGIHMSEIPAFAYELLWGERVIRSVANLTRQDGVDFFDVARRVPLRTETHAFPLEQANEALDLLRRGGLEGAAVLVTGGGG